ncbi:StbB family protein [Burkholderia sp. PAMC 26561]|uniref:StbB family protein n=1 Tax=Burkholderia sp. PAMC 26561 TaxID=1795043 RepID=UPI00076B506E|nr:StbB family protein [Burkholderia sp. PAMC 26561]AME27473.1 hypothetical protein AXG89_26455 [Burkholderia sp. PAMC 26561]
MNIAVINFSGNVGKSTIARHLLAPRVRDAKVIAVESINADDGAQETDEKFRGRQFSELQARLLSGDNVVVDVGASNVESFVALMSEYDGSHDDFDLFVVPVVSAEKQQRDTVATLLNLANMGIAREKIVVVFNQVDRVLGFQESQFSSIFSFYNLKRSFRLDRDAVLYQSDVYKYAAEAGRSMDAVLTDPTDYKSAIAETPASSEKNRLVALLGLRRLALRVNAELDAVFEAIVRPAMTIAVGARDE